MNKNTLSIIAVSGLAIVFASCGSMKQGTAFSERKYFNFPHHNPVVVFDTKKNAEHGNIAVLPVKEQKQVTGLSVSKEGSIKTVIAPNQVKIAKSNAIATPNKATTQEPIQREVISSYTPANEMSPLSEHNGGGDPSTNTILLVILAILVAPLAVYLYDNAATTRFVIVLVLWLVGIFAWGFIFLGLALLAAIIYAILIVTGNVS